MTRAKTQRPKSRGGSRAGTNARKGTEGAYDQMVAELAELDENDENDEIEEAIELPRKRASEPKLAAPAPPKPKVPFPDRNRPPTGPAPRLPPGPRTAPPGPPPPGPRPAPRTIPPGPPPIAALVEPVRTRPPTPPPLIPPPEYAEDAGDEVPIDVEPHHHDDDLDEVDADELDLPDEPAPPPRAPPEDSAVASDELPEISQLAIGIYDTELQLQAAQRAIQASGHLVGALADADASDGLEIVSEAIREGDVDAILVGLPGGEALIDAALALAPRRPVVIAACSGDPNEAVGRAASSGADLVVLRPYTLERIAPVLLAAARLADDRNASSAARGSEAVLRARLLADPEPAALQSFELFQRVLELEIKRAKRYLYPIAVALFAVEIPPNPPPGIRGILRARAGNALVHALRDIDLATEVDQERFLVLMPYTDLAGSADVARRIIAAVAANDAVVAAGRSFRPKLVGAVASGMPGQVSLARLMQDATKALEQARRDGAELAVPI